MRMLLATAACLYLTAGVIYFGRRRKSYRHLRHTISELGEKGAEDAGKVNFGFFLPLGIVLVLLAFSSPGTALQGLATCLAAPGAFPASGRNYLI